MGRVIDLSAKHAADRIYRELLADTLQRLESAAGMLMEDLVNLAMRGPWRDWSEAQQVGGIAQIDDAALAECGDSRIAQLNLALRQMRASIATVRELAARPPH